MSQGFLVGKRKMLLLVLLAAIVLFGCAGVSGDIGKEEPKKVLMDMLSAGHWQPIAMTALLISFFIVSLAYMLAEFLRKPELNAWAKNELYEVLISAFLLASVFFLVGAGEFVAQNFTMGENHIEWGHAYLENVKVLLEFEMYPILLMVDLVVSTFATWNFSFPFEVSLVTVMLGTSPVSGLQMIGGALVFMLDSIGMFIAVVLAQMAFLEFAAVFALGLFLPLGIVLRTFPLTRKLGSTLIALAFTMYFVYPITLALNQEVFDAAYVPLSNMWGDVALGNPNALHPSDILEHGKMNIGGGVTEDQLLIENILPDPAEKPWYLKLLNLGELWTVVVPGVQPPPILSIFSANDLLPPVGWIKFFHDLTFRYFGPWMAQAAVLVLVLPVIDIIICITFFRSFSLAIGGEPQIMGLTKIV